jgi:apolipoprotein N-acyltransferase
MIRLTAVLAWVGYTAGLYWIYISLHVYGHMPAWLALLGTGLLSAYVALYAVGAAATVRALKLNFSDRSAPLVIAAAVTLFEWLRGHLFTGFPWLALGYLAVDTPLAGLAPVLGSYGVGFAVALTLALIAQAIRYRYWSALIAVVALLIAGFALSFSPFTEPAGRPLRAALVQGAIPQSMKFDPARELQSITTQLELARGATTPGAAHLIVFPETALVRPWDFAAPDVREAFHRLASLSNATVMLGLPMRDADGYRNSLIALEAQTPLDQFAGRYDKHHLVPFGEFIPWGFRWFVDAMKMPLGDFQRGAAVQPPITVRDQRIGVNICFEDLFGEEIIRPLHPSRPADDQPTVLLNVSNLAWFGNTIALSQHLAIARMRSMETGRPTLRATNTGATAAIDHRGRVLDMLPFGESRLLITQVQGMQGSTPFSRWGNLPIMALSILLLAIAAVRRKVASR